jgi:AbrB family looped-hinge helix DNA binding protein
MSNELQGVTIHVGPQGRVVIPAEIRRAWNLETGDVLVARLGDDVLVLERPAQVVERIRQRFAHLRGRPSLVDELIADRRREAERENRATN